MYLAAIAGAQPQTPALPPQMAPQPSMQQGFYMQHPQVAAMTQQQGEGEEKHYRVMMPTMTYQRGPYPRK
ncbi:GRF1-interacting factor [Trifolium repens]|nr:GRF1-interacting factor [Trifolium repens]